MAVRAVRSGLSQACWLVLTLLCANEGLQYVYGARMLQEERNSGRKLSQFPWSVNGVTAFFDTPTVAGSTSVAANANGGFGIDGTQHIASGVAASNAFATSWDFGSDGQDFAIDDIVANRPQVSTAAFVAVPQLLGKAVTPTIGYSFAEALGDLFSTTNNMYAVNEFGYNPIGNNLGTSTSAAAGQNFNLGGMDTVFPWGDGFSGVEAIGTADEQTDAADSRTFQTGQSVNYPYSVFSPMNPLGCSQVLLHGANIAMYDLGAPWAPLPGPVGEVIPFCLEYFNFQNLDAYESFIAGYDDTYDDRVSGGDIFRIFTQDGATAVDEAASVVDPPGTPPVNLTSPISTRGARPRRQQGPQLVDANAYKGGTGSKGTLASSLGVTAPNGDQARQLAIQASNPKIKMSGTGKKGVQFRQSAGEAQQDLQGAVMDQLYQTLQETLPEPLADALFARAQESPLTRLFAGTAEAIQRTTQASAMDAIQGATEVMGQAWNLTTTVFNETAKAGVNGYVGLLETAEPYQMLGFNVGKFLYDNLQRTSNTVVNASMDAINSLLPPEQVRMVMDNLAQQAAEATGAAARAVTGEPSLASVVGDTQQVGTVVQMGERTAPVSSRSNKIADIISEQTGQALGSMLNGAPLEPTSSPTPPTASG